MDDFASAAAAVGIAILGRVAICDTPVLGRIVILGGIHGTVVLRMKQRVEPYLRKIWEDVKERKGREVDWVYNDGANERVQVWFGLEEVAETENLIPVLEPDIGDHEAECTRAELVACEGEAE